MNFTFNKKTIFIFIFSVLLLGVVLSAFIRNTKKVKSSSEWVEHTQEALGVANNVLLDVLNIETGTRGYLLSGDVIYLNPYTAAIHVIHSDITKLELLTKDNERQQLRIHKLKRAVQARLDYTSESIRFRMFNTLNKVERIKNLANGKILTDNIRELIAEITSEEMRLLAERKIDSKHSNSNMVILFVMLIVLIVFILGLVIINLINQKAKDKYAESEKQASQYARSLIEASLDPLVTISGFGKITDVNEASVAVTGISADELIGSDFSNYFTEPERAREGYLQVFDKGFVSDFPLTIKHKNGKLTDVLYNASVYKDDKGNVLGVFAAARDVTNHKKAQVQLEELNKELEAFSYSVSHDLRAPLRAINGYAKILEEDFGAKLDMDGKVTLAAIIKNSKRMGELIDDLLAFSKLGRKVVLTTDVNMKSLVQAVLEETVQQSPQLEIKVNELFSVRGQQALLKQVWVNLISNAIKYSQHKAKIIIEIGSYKKENQLIYYVKDNGAGFDMQYYAKLFGVFQRLHSQEEFEGTGIGLAIVQKIVSRHNGKVWAEAKIEEGATFYFSLPIVTEELKEINLNAA